MAKILISDVPPEPETSLANEFWRILQDAVNAGWKATPATMDAIIEVGAALITTETNR